MARIAHNLVDRIGQRFGRLVVVARHGSRGTAATWACACDCGNTKVVTSNALRGRYTQSCGCSRRTGPNSRPTYTCRLPPGEAARAGLLMDYRSSAAKRGLSWTISDEEFFALTRSDCAYCGVSPYRTRRVSRNGSYSFNGVDRVNNGSGYETGNVVPCCSVCNHAKRDMTRDAFMAWIARLICHHTDLPTVEAAQ